MKSNARSSGWAAQRRANPQSLRILGLALSACSLVACAASPKAELQPSVPGAVSAPADSFAAQPEPRTLEDAEAQLERARQDLEQLAGSTAPQSATGAATPAPAPAPPEDRAERAQTEAAPAAKAESHCQSACRAFSSLTRASEAVCRLDAEDGKRCERARKIREDSSQRVAACGCVQ